ncbi:ferritin-like domain-containing protein [Geomesophilobacter sediminis]|uniref:Ferritin family protein n=1 Tax=Geomesophilobacter sediminis TaxID=2798584 RepID=A0A8J7LZ65_9BACT|nr:ferritin family protein [Geomesophilobacter sediminis]MBJ6726217.1 ferritin family protein [Geomesophilobacter sediminis]
MGDVQEAIKVAMQTEKDAMKFYELGASKMTDPGAKKLFQQLAKEEREHAMHFFKAYNRADVGTFEEFMAAPNLEGATWVGTLEGLILADFNEQTALEAALQKEGELEKKLIETANRLSDPAVKEVFDLNARETRNHYLTIEAEYARVMAMVDESDMDTYVRE